MKKILISTLAIIAFSATALMAHQTDKINLELDKHILDAVTEVTHEGVEQTSAMLAAEVIHKISIQNNIIKNKILEKVKSADKIDALKYSRLYSAFSELEAVRASKFFNIPQEHIGQELFIKLDNLAKAINNLPSASDRDFFTDQIANTVLYFEYMEKVVNTSKLFDIATSYKELFLSGNAAIEKSKLSNMNLVSYSIEEYVKIIEK